MIYSILFSNLVIFGTSQFDFIFGLFYFIYFFKLDMRGRNLRKQSDVVKVETYNSLKNQLEQQNAALLQERLSIQQQSRQHQQNLPSIIVSPQNQRAQRTSSPINSVRQQGHVSQSSSTVDQLRSKISQIITICHNESGPYQFGEVVQAQKQILAYLDSIQQSNRRYGKQIQTPIQQSSRKKKSRLNKTENCQNVRQSMGYGNYFSDEAMQMIEEIQRKALVQIQALRIDKINLLKRLNQEIKAHNQEKRLRNVLESKLRSLSEPNQRRGERYMEVVAEENQESYHDNPEDQVGSLPQQSRNRVSKQHTRKRSNFHPSNNIPQQYQQPHPQLNYNHTQTAEFNNPSPKSGQAQNISNQISKQIERLNKQNKKIKQALSLPQHPNLKLQLRSQLGQLEGKIRFYEQELSQRQRSTTNLGVNQLENLILQANNITQDGNKLLKNNGRENRPSSNLCQPEFSIRYRTSLNDLQNTKKIQQRSTFDYTRPPLQTFSPMDKSYHSQTFKGGFSPTKYENLIEQMNRATKI